ncbi:MAG: glycoside hydrolase family 88/105 protein [Candidatus Cyclobacteriaceae bacterium M3_2C_046]
MKSVIPILIAVLYFKSSIIAQDNIYSTPYIKNIINKTNDYQYNHPWKETDDNWIRGTYYTGVMAAYKATGDKRYLEQCNDWGEKHDWTLPVAPPDANQSGANLLTCSQTWLESYLIDPQPEKLHPTLAHLKKDNIKNPTTRPLTYYYEGGRRYVDALYVGPPVFAMLAKITDDPIYLDWMDSFFWDVYGELYDQQDSLFYRDYRYKPEFEGHHFRADRPDTVIHEEARKSYTYQTTEQGKKVIWSRGNGWAFAGLARILSYLPKNNGNYPKYLELYKQMAIQLKKRQQPDGFWYPNLDDPLDYPIKESSGTGFFTYGLAWGINNGILASQEYLPVVKKGWEALVSVVNEDGKVEWGQLVGASPYKIQKDDSHEYVTGTFLLAASEIYKLADTVD